MNVYVKLVFIGELEGTVRSAQDIFEQTGHQGTQAVEPDCVHNSSGLESVCLQSAEENQRWLKM